MTRIGFCGLWLVFLPLFSPIPSAYLPTNTPEPSFVMFLLTAAFWGLWCYTLIAVVLFVVFLIMNSIAESYWYSRLNEWLDGELK